MPNWCSTCIVFYSENKEQLAAMQKRFTEIVDGDATQENDFGKGWLGDFANTFYPEIGALNIECRGSCDPILEMEHNEKFDCFRMLTTTASKREYNSDCYQRYLQKRRMRCVGI